MGSIFSTDTLGSKPKELPPLNEDHRRQGWSGVAGLEPANTPQHLVAPLSNAAHFVRPYVALMVDC